MPRDELSLWISGDNATEIASSPLYERLIGGGVGDEFNRHVFACAIVIATTETERAVTVGLGLNGAQMAALLEAYFPNVGARPFPGTVDDTAGEDALEEPDLRQLLLEHRTTGVIEEEWLAAIVARRSLNPNHLWQDLGLRHRRELSALLNRHFGQLAVRNVGDMKWKKFFYRELCQRDGIFVCKAPVCSQCSDFNHCFGEETGDPLSGLAKTAKA